MSKKKPLPFEAIVESEALCVAVDHCIKAHDQIMTLSFSDGLITIRAQTTTFGIEHRIPATIAAPHADVVVRARDLDRALLELRGPIGISESDYGLQIRDDLFTTILPIYEEDRVWPSRFKPKTTVKIPAEIDFGGSIQQVLTHSGKDKERTNLYGAAFEHDGQRMNLVATNGHRMGILGATFDAAVVKSTLINPVVARLIEPGVAVTITLDDSRILFEMPTSTIWSVLNKSYPPPWREVLPAHLGDPDHASLGIEREPLLGAARKLYAIKVPRAYVGMKSSELGLSLGTLGTELGDYPSGSCCIEAHGSTGSARVAVDASYLVDAIEFCKHSRLSMQWSGQHDPIVISDLDHMVILMPVRGV